MKIKKIGLVDLSSIVGSKTPGVAVVDKDGNTYVSDQGNGSIYKISSSGLLLSHFNSLPSNTFGITAMVYSPVTNKIYILFNDSIFTMNPDGTTSVPIVMGTGGTTFGITVDPTGYVYAMYSTTGPNFLLNYYSSALSLLNTYNVGEIAVGSLTWTPDGHIAVCPANGNQIQLITSTGTLIHTYNIPGASTGQITFFDGVAYLPNITNVLILDSGYNVTGTFGDQDGLNCVDGIGSGLLAIVGHNGFLPDVDNGTIVFYSGFIPESQEVNQVGCFLLRHHKEH
jgi:hypothetical protein